ncbi:MAG: FAD-dependent oxidoreductase, partial [Acidimicrobiales bacterium]|nr:FAD-dependent oxidoreductase [Acidimicrobiales bacterium]
MRHVVVVGGSLGGLRAAQTLRSEGFDAKLTIISEEKWPAYDRPPLSKQVLRGQWDQDRIVLSGADDDSLGIDWRRGVRAQSLDAGERRLTLSDGSTMSYDGLIIASGARARRLAGTENLREVHSLRTLDDARALRSSLRERARLLVVGAGFIGAEVAASARSMGAEVTLVEPLSAPLARVLGDEMGEIMAQLHRDNGVDLRLGVGVESMEGQDQLRSVVLSDGTMVPADVAVVGIGVIPNVEWLEGNGFDLSNGILCDETTQVAPRIVACGDVARWPNPLFGETMRVEHWEHTIDMAGHA